MNNVVKFIESGIIESYVLGLASPDEQKEVELMASMHTEVNEEIENISRSLQTVSAHNAPQPNSTVRPLIMATVDYVERIKHGEAPSDPPILNENSQLLDYQEWLSRPDMILPDDFNDIFIKIIAHTPQAISAIVWIEEETPYEVHEAEYEKFLIVEGTCDIIIDEKPHSLVAGDYMSIPLHSGHIVKVTSTIPCKVILQRVAA